MKKANMDKTIKKIENESLRVGFFTDSYLPNIDGVVRSLSTNRDALEARGHFVSVYASGSREAKRSNTDRQVHYFTGVSIPFYKQYKFALHPFPAIKAAKRERLQIVHCHGVLSMGMAAKATARALGLPLAGTFHTLIPTAAESFLRPRALGTATCELLWRAFGRFYKNFDVVTAPSGVIKRELLEHGVDAPLAVIPNAVDCKRFKPAPAASVEREKKKWCPRGESLVLCAGRISKEKNIDVLIRAMPLILEARGKAKPGGRTKFVITGEGPAKLACQKLAARLGLWGDVLFPGFVEEKELPLLYAAADCVASASTFETQGLAVLEAMACGTPCAAARALAFADEVRDGRNGFLFEPGSAEDAAEKIARLLATDGRKRAGFAREARASALAVDVPIVAAKWEELYAGLL